jgi:hypothetical protein
MKVRAADISEQFDLLIAGRRSREEIEMWAVARMHAEDARTLEYEPPEDEMRLWDAIKYLGGVGLKVAPDEYLYCEEDFIKYRRAAQL